MKDRMVVAVLALLMLQTDWAAATESGGRTTPGKVYVIPIREDIMPPMVYLVRRGVKEAMEAKASLLVLDMETNGGRVDTTEEIIKILNQFQGQTVTYVNKKAFSAGAFIAFATQKIYMAPESVIGAAAPMLMVPGGGPAEISETMEAKITSGIRALVRANAEKNGHNVDVAEAMIDKTKHLEIEGDVLNEKGQILTLTAQQAEKTYGDPPKPLLSAGTVETLERLIPQLGFEGAARVYVEPTGVEILGTWINKISPLLLLIGIVGLYIEFKTPGFGLPGIVGLTAFGIYFFGSYVAGLSGAEWVALFVLGLLLFILELFVFPGTLYLGLFGATLMLMAIVMAMVDIYPSMPGLPTPMRVRVPVGAIITNLSIVVVGLAASIWMLRRWLPQTSLYATLVSQSASGEASVALMERQASLGLGEVGRALSDLRPGGKAQFGDRILDVVSCGDLIPKDSRVKVIEFRVGQPVVEAAE